MLVADSAQGQVFCVSRSYFYTCLNIKQLSANLHPAV